MEYFDLSEDFILEERPPARPDARLDAAIDDAWALCLEDLPENTFNGSLFAVVDHQPERIVVERTDFKHLSVYRKSPELFAGRRPLSPLGVTGFLFCRDGLVLGRRSASVALYPGAWEPVPSGHLASLDPVDAIFLELKEELGVSRGDVTAAQPIGLAYDPDAGVFDILFRLTSRLSRDEVLAAKAAGGSDEYDELAFIAPDQIAEFTAQEAGRVVPTLLAPVPQGGGQP